MNILIDCGFMNVDSLSINKPDELGGNKIAVHLS